jgi:hypothetical protein
MEGLTHRQREGAQTGSNGRKRLLKEMMFFGRFCLFLAKKRPFFVKNGGF